MHTTEPPSWREDLAHYAQEHVPIMMFCLGNPSSRVRIAEARAQGVFDLPPPLHSAFYDPDPEPSIATGIKAMTAAVEGLLPPSGQVRLAALAGHGSQDPAEELR